MTIPWRYLSDLLERTIRTFVQAYLGYWLSLGGGNYDTLFTINNLKVAVAAAALAVATAVVGKGVGNPSSASVLPAAAEPVPEPARLPQPTMGSDETRRQLDDLLAQLNRLPADRVAPPPPPPLSKPPPGTSYASDSHGTTTWTHTQPAPLLPPPVRDPAGLMINPDGVGGRDPTSDGNR